jgi:uncharacterized protein DUF3592
MAIPFLVGGMVSVNEWTQFSSVADREKTARGIVIREEGGDHKRYEFVFQIDGRSRTGLHGNECQPDVLVVGQEVEVHYDPTNPDLSELCSFSARAQNEFWFVLACLGAVLVILIFSLQKPGRIVF